MTRPRAVAVVVDAGRVLVVGRRRNGSTYAVLPGGGVEPGESPAEAAVRELTWASADELDAMDLRPAGIRDCVRELLGARTAGLEST